MKPLHATPGTSAGSAAVPEDFSLVLGGPLYQLLLKTRLASPALGLLHRRMLVIPALAWLPLLVLTLMEGNALGGVGVPFLSDIEAYARFLLAMPILLLAEPVVHQQVREIIREFRGRGIVSAESMPRFEGAIGETMRWRNSLFAEIALLAIVLLVGPWAWQHGLALQTDTWYASVDAGRTELTRAGWWFIYVSAPMFQFLLLRWYFRLALWWRFLWRISRIPLELRALHPDRAGGLDFLGDSISAFMPVLFAQSVVVSGIIASRVMTGASGAIEFRDQVIVMIILMVAVIIIPLLFFSPKLTASRRKGRRRFGAFATAYVSDFDRKWLEGSMPTTEPLVGSADIQSLADLAGSSDIVREMRTVPFGLRTFIWLVVATSVPFFPLVLTVIPLGELVREAVGLML
jgi:hypothetical protein